MKLEHPREIDLEHPREIDLEQNSGDRSLRDFNTIFKGYSIIQEVAVGYNLDTTLSTTYANTNNAKPPDNNLTFHIYSKGTGPETLYFAELTQGVNRPEVIIPNTITYNDNNNHDHAILVRSIYHAFANFDNLEKVTIPDNVEILRSKQNIRSGSFAECSKLTSVTITDTINNPSKLEFIGKHTFYASAITSITIPASVTSIGYGAFQECYKLTSVTIPASVTSIGNGAFSFCFNLTSVTITDTINNPSKLEFINNFAFFGSAITSITIPASVTRIGDGAFSNSPIKSFTVQNDNIYYSTSADKRVLFENETVLHTYATGSTVNSYEVPAFVTEIKSEAFNHSDNREIVKSLTILTFAPGSQVTIIGAFFIENSLVEEFIVPVGVREIVTHTFYDALALTKLTLPDTITSIQPSKFNNSELNNLTEITIVVRDRDTTRANNRGALDEIADINDLLNGTDNEVYKYITTNFPNITITYDFYIKIYFSYLYSPICFPGETRVDTDKGKQLIKNLKAGKDRIRGNTVLGISQSITPQSYLIEINKNALGKKMPCEKTVVSAEHKFLVDGQMIKSRDLVEIYEGVHKIKYQGDILYNVILDVETGKDEKMVINNLIAETLSKNSEKGKLFIEKDGPYTKKEKTERILKHNKIMYAIKTIAKRRN
jgi:hypothetical protein